MFERINRPSGEKAKDRQKELRLWLLVATREVVLTDPILIQRTRYRYPELMKQILAQIQLFMDSMDSAEYLPRLLDLLHAICDNYLDDFRVVFKIKDVMDHLVAWCIDLNTPKSFTGLLSESFRKFWMAWREHLKFGVQLLRQLFSDMQKEAEAANQAIDISGKTSLRAIIHAVCYASFPSINPESGSVLEANPNFVKELLSLTRKLLGFMLQIGQKFEDRLWIAQAIDVVRLLSKAMGSSFAPLQNYGMQCLLLELSWCFEETSHEQVDPSEINKWLGSFEETIVLWTPALDVELSRDFLSPSESKVMGDLRWHCLQDERATQRLHSICRIAFARLPETLGLAPYSEILFETIELIREMKKRHKVFLSDTEVISRFRSMERPSSEAFAAHIQKVTTRSTLLLRNALHFNIKWLSEMTQISSFLLEENMADIIHFFVASIWTESSSETPRLKGQTWWYELESVILYEMYPDPEFRLGALMLWKQYLLHLDPSEEEFSLTSNFISSFSDLLYDFDEDVSSAAVDVLSMFPLTWTEQFSGSQTFEKHIDYEVTKAAIMASPYLGTFRSRHFQLMMSYLGMSNFLQVRDEPLNLEIGWLERVFHTCQNEDILGALLTGTAIEGPSFLKKMTSNELMVFWGVWESARFCILSRLRTPFGGPGQLFDALEQTLNSLMSASGRNSDISASKATLKDLVLFIDILELQIYQAAAGSALFTPAPPKASLAFFHANRKVCEEWFIRIRKSLASACHILQNVPELHLRHTSEALRERSLSLKTGVVKDYNAWCTDIDNFALSLGKKFLSSSSLPSDYFELSFNSLLHGMPFWMSGLKNDFEEHRNALKESRAPMVLKKSTSTPLVTSELSTLPVLEVFALISEESYEDALVEAFDFMREMRSSEDSERYGIFSSLLCQESYCNLVLNDWESLSECIDEGKKIWFKEPPDVLNPHQTLFNIHWKSFELLMNPKDLIESSTMQDAVDYGLNFKSYFHDLLEVAATATAVDSVKLKFELKREIDLQLERRLFLETLKPSSDVYTRTCFWRSLQKLRNGQKIGKTLGVHSEKLENDTWRLRDSLRLLRTAHESNDENYRSFVEAFGDLELSGYDNDLIILEKGRVLFAKEDLVSAFQAARKILDTHHAVDKSILADSFAFLSDIMAATEDLSLWESTAEWGSIKNHRDCPFYSLVPSETLLYYAATLNSHTKHWFQFSNVQYNIAEGVVGRLLDKSHAAAVLNISLESSAPSSMIMRLREWVRDKYEIAATGFTKILQTDEAASEQSLTSRLRLLRILTHRVVFLSASTFKEIKKIPSNQWLRILPQIFSLLSHSSTTVSSWAAETLEAIANDNAAPLVYPTVVGLLSPKLKLKESTLNTYSRLYNVVKNMTSDRFVVDLERVVFEFQRITVLWEELWFNLLSRMHSDLLRRYDRCKKEFKRIDESLMMSSLPQDLNKLETFRIMYRPIVYTINDMIMKTFDAGPSTPHEEWFSKLFEARIRDILVGMGDVFNIEQVKDIMRKLTSIQADIGKEMSSNRVLNLKDLSPFLASLDKDCCIPLPTSSFEHTVGVSALMNSQVQVLSTKTKPKKVMFEASDGKSYAFLFKGLEDLHLDERMQQFIGTGNSLLRFKGRKNEPVFTKTYAVVPFGDTFGMIEWVENATQLFVLFKRWQQRDHLAKFWQRKESDGVENAPPLPRPHASFHSKLNAALKRHKTMANCSSSRRTVVDVCINNYFLRKASKLQQLTAMTSILGYIIGLGDRHLDNIMLDLRSGNVIHIDFNVCFEKGARLRVPERVPFRLTQNLETPLKVPGVYGSFVASCESTLQITYKYRDSLKALLESFIHDPLMEWTDDIDEGRRKMKLEFDSSRELLQARLVALSPNLSLYSDKYLSLLNILKPAFDPLMSVDRRRKKLFSRLKSESIAFCEFAKGLIVDINPCVYHLYRFSRELRELLRFSEKFKNTWTLWVKSLEILHASVIRITLDDDRTEMTYLKMRKLLDNLPKSLSTELLEILEQRDIKDTEDSRTAETELESSDLADTFGLLGIQRMRTENEDLTPDEMDQKNPEENEVEEVDANNLDTTGLHTLDLAKSILDVIDRKLEGTNMATGLAYTSTREQIQDLIRSRSHFGGVGAFGSTADALDFADASFIFGLKPCKSQRGSLKYVGDVERQRYHLHCVQPGANAALQQAVNYAGVASVEFARQTYFVPYPQPLDADVPPSETLHVTHLPQNYVRAELVSIGIGFHGYGYGHSCPNNIASRDESRCDLCKMDDEFSMWAETTPKSSLSPLAPSFYMDSMGSGDENVAAWLSSIGPLPSRDVIARLFPTEATNLSSLYATMVTTDRAGTRRSHALLSEVVIEKHVEGIIKCFCWDSSLIGFDRTRERV
ncbi:hypothetical protein BC829DRAFT_414483 [Chytridium lagenaria]|nr:hypothetical protein BC829DRAFT_414483 [Chytridium lagenaria]